MSGASLTKVFSGPVVTRSQAKSKTSNYADHQEQLRFDFWYSCAYCTLTEVESLARGFEIDHYEPITYAPSLKADYTNLFWSCEHCNRLKSDIAPPPHVRAAGNRFIRVDQESPLEHLEADGAKLSPRTQTGTFNIQVLNLNRRYLCEIRELRQRLHASNERILLGLRALAGMSVDQLPAVYRNDFLRLSGEAPKRAQALAGLLDEKVLKQLNRSSALDKDPEAASQTKARREFLKGINALVPDPY